jgi:enoyl-CoA hydratase/carnithine racemase
MGYRKALEIIIEGRRITASQCLEHGLANRIVPPGQAGHAAREWARQLCAGAPLAQAGAKKALRHMGRMRLQDAITLEAKIQEKLVASEDFRHGVEAFFGKRKPNFRGR